MTIRQLSSAQRLLSAREELMSVELGLWWDEDIKAARAKVVEKIERKLREKGWTYVAPLCRWYRIENIRKLRHLA